MSDISPEELGEQLQTDESGLLVVDIRHKEEFDEWHVPGSVNVDIYDELADDPDKAKDALSDLPKEKEIVTVCGAGIAAETAADVIQEMDYNAATLEDGMNGWSRVHRHAPVQADIDGTLVQVARPGKGCLSHVLISDGEAAVFDPSHYLEEYDAILDEYDAELVGVFDTHAHADHVSGGAELADRHGVPYYLHPKDALAVDATAVEDEQTVSVGSLDLEVIHTPGHSEGSVSFDIDGAALITGDTLFHESVGRVELGVEAGIGDSNVEQNAATLYESLQRLQDRPDAALVLPAHDPGSPEPPVTATLGEVRERNEDLGRDREEFIQELASDIPDHPPNFERVKRTNVGQESVPSYWHRTFEQSISRWLSH
ncbi:MULTISPECIES: rhodanese-like domain-containing protein [unclassified Haloferax]|uniref:MBL fold metallo-hydrolase n=1 Tax=unclassified Haloferax TaxID=2625095 RepID=UPI0028757444|nr:MULTISPECIES: rhodanese-like domain-containing protein [unclassified Haloferax]MDS0243711.1 rhodanese-like domain-containing protein [Haloferax sp. S2CR25]MDS0446832.1 rhodanese-like domain-containing protein [Haloferax sp. S2CR25-2]